MPQLPARSRRGIVLVVVFSAGIAPGVTGAGPPDGPDRPDAIGPYLDGRLPRVAPAPSGGWKAVPAFPLLTFEDPTFLVPEPGSRRLYVGGRQGLIEAFDADPNASAKSVVLDLRGRCQGFDDSGLMGLAFHPEFARPGSPDRGYFYVFYNQTRNPQRGPDRPANRETTNRLSRFTVPDGSDRRRPQLRTRPDRPGRREPLAQRRRSLLPPSGRLPLPQPRRRGGRLRQHPADRPRPVLRRDPDRRRPPWRVHQPSDRPTARHRGHRPLLHPQRQSLGRRPGRARGVLVHRPAEPAPDDDRPPDRPDLAGRCRRRFARRDRPDREGGQLPVELPRGGRRGAARCQSP